MGLLESRTIIIIGGAGLLGKAFARAIAGEGGRAVIADIDKGKAEAAAHELSGAPVSGAYAAEPVDIADAESVDGLLARVSAAYGRVDGVVNSAYPRNARYGRRLEEVAYADFNENLGLHLGGYFLVCQRAAAHLKSSGGGVVVNIASIYGITAPRFGIYEGTSMTMPVEYAAIKAGLIHLTKYFASYFKGSGVRFNCLSPGGVRDGQPESFLERYAGYADSKGMLDPVDVAGTLVYLLSDLSAFVKGQNIVVDDGWTL